MVTPRYSPRRISSSYSHGSAVDTFKQASVKPSPLSKAVITISSTESASLDSGINASAALAFSSDHLIHLIQHNVHRALSSNKSLLLAATLKLEASDSTSSIKQFPTQICGGLTVIRPLVNQLIPDSLYPTQLQMDCAHTDWINAFPFPKFRDNLIKRGVHFVPEEMFRDLFGDIFPEYITPMSIPSSYMANRRFHTEEFEDQDDYTAGRRCLISWGDPWVITNWEVTPGFLKSWGWTLKGCSDLIEASNRWRALRNEKPITCM
ncbi:FAD dependent oxidoreductase domain-containing protein [Rutstroemia sp. NJR-2017a BBW]|nr:FAD dependent oxidoreductase domain-containing protein [Rutstroemia sp. NJR-2017a BBW]